MAMRRLKKKAETSEDTQVNKEDGGHKNGEKSLEPAYALAAGLAWQDRVFLIPWYLVLILPELSLASMHSPSHGFVLFYQLASSALEMTFLYFICRRWICRLSRTSKRLFDFQSFVQFLLIGFAFWFMLVFPLVISMYLSPAKRIIPLLILIPALMILLRFYFYFFPAALHEKSVSVILRQAAQFTERDRLLALKVLATPIGIMLLCSSAIGSISPDGRHVEVLWLASLTEGLYPILKAYIGFAIALYLLNDPEWHKQELDPYRNARLNTLELGAPAWLGKFLRPKTGVYLIVIGALIWLANQSRAVQMPPSPSVILQEISISEIPLSDAPAGNNPNGVDSSTIGRSRVTLKLLLTDQNFQFRSFFPQFFNLSGESGVVLANGPEEILINGTPLTNENFGALSSLSSMTVHLTFLTDRTREQLQALEDLHLWYRRARLIQLDMKSAKGVKNTTRSKNGVSAS